MYKLLMWAAARLVVGAVARALVGAVARGFISAAVRIITGAVVSGVSLALFVWLRSRPAGPYWSGLPGYWLSRASWPFWLSTSGLTVVGILLTPRGSQAALPAVAFGTGVAYVGLLFLREARTGIPFWGQVAAFWPDALLLGLALGAGAFAAGLVTCGALPHGSRFHRR